MKVNKVQNLFKHPFLSHFVFAPDLLPFKDSEVIKFDEELSRYEQLFLNPDVERSLITKNELLASFAISKAETSQLTLSEAQEVYDFVINNKDYDFVRRKLKEKKPLTQKDYEKLEFFNIAKTFREVSRNPFSIDNLAPNFIKDIHKQLTQGLDVFTNLPNFNPYKAGHWRDNDTIRVGEYIPASYQTIGEGVKELIEFLKKNKSITSVALFHTSLYALHPFNNGNKRVCRILEHVLLRSLGINSKNLFSTSYYYHKQKPRYYKYLLYSIERKNLNHFVSFVLEAIVLSIISVVKTSLEVKRDEFIDSQTTNSQTKAILKPLIKRKEMQFKNLFKHVKRKMARQTFVTYLSKATEDKIVTKREEGRTTYYSLNLKTVEETTLRNWLQFAQKRLSFIPDDLRLI